MSEVSTERSYPNKFGRIVLLAMEEVLGRNGLNAVLKIAGLNQYINQYPPNNFDLGFTNSNFSQIMEALDRLYGPTGGRGLALRIGRACFKYGVREFGPIMGVSDLAFRLLPLSMKLKVGGEALAEVFHRDSDQDVSFEEDEGHFLMRFEACPVCYKRSTPDPCCFLVVGILQEALFWVSGGKNFLVEEKQCLACGDPVCLFSVDKNSLS